MPSTFTTDVNTITDEREHPCDREGGKCELGECVNEITGKCAMIK